MFETDDGIRLQAYNLRDVVGKTITCDDGVARRVEFISYSQRFPTRVLINEILEDETPGGAWVHALSLSCQMFKEPLPTKEQRDAFDRVMGSFQWVPEQKREKNGLVRLPSGILVNSN